MNATIDYQRFTTSLVMNTPSPAFTRVSECGMFITCGEHTLSIVKWREGLQKLASEVKKELDDLCLNQTFNLLIPKTTFDDWGNDKRGYSWTKNGDFLSDKRALLAAMLTKPELKLAQLDSTGKLTFNTAAIWAFIHKCSSVNEKLALLAFFTAGQTPRVSEFIEHKYVNSTRPRTMFRDFEALWFATRRVKTENIVEKETFLPMKCHPELTALLERYLLIVRPVEAELVKIVKNEKQYHVYKEYLWTKNGQRVTPDQMRASILKFNTDYCGMKAGTKIYRHMCVEMVRVFLGSEFELREEELDALAAQAGHSITMSRLRYASEMGMLPSMSSDLLLRFGRASEAWWEHTGFKPGFPPLLPLRARQELRSNTALSSQNHPVAAPVIDIQAIILAVTSAVVTEVQKMQGNLGAQIQRSVADALAEVQHPNIGQNHHAPPPHLSSPGPGEDFLMDETESSALPMTDIYGDLVDPEDSEATQHSVAPYRPALPSIHHDRVTMDETESSALPMTDIYGDLIDPEDSEATQHSAAPHLPALLSIHHDRVTDPVPTAISDKYLNKWLAQCFPQVPSPSFQSPEQKEAVQLAVERRRSFVAVLPAGEGQSLTYTLPALDDSKKGPSYIIAPRSALIHTQAAHVRTINIRAKQWQEKNKKVDKESLVFLTIASANSKHFKEYVFIFSQC